MQIHTIGFAKKSARQFFTLLRENNIRQLIDVRLSNSSQLAGFTKAGDLEFFLREIGAITYVHEPLFAPSEQMFKAYKQKKEMPWSQFQREFLALLAERQIEKNIPRKLFATPSVLLCSEPTAEHCHRRLVLEYLQDKWSGVKIVHL